MGEFQPTRREVLKTAVLGAAALWLLNGCSTESTRQNSATAYLQTDLPASEYGRIGERLGSAIRRIGHIPLAFAEFNQSTASVRTPSINPELKRLVGSTSRKTELSIAIGGASIEAEPWLSGMANPARFSTSVDDARKQIEDIFQRRTHVDLDCEDVLPAAQFAQLVHTVRDKLPADRRLTLAVPATGDVMQTFDPRRLGDAPQLYRVMTYDWHGSWSDRTGPVASGPWDMAAIGRWVSMIGDERRISVGYPAYGYEFVGAKTSGATFDPNLVRSIPYTGIPPESIHDNIADLTSEAMLDGNWTSCLSPNIIGRIATNMANGYPHLDGSFFWSMHGLTPAHLEAVNASIA